MNPWPCGISTGCFYQTSFTDALPHIEAAGFPFVEICSFPRHLDYHQAGLVHTAANALEGAGIRAVSFHAPFAETIDISSPDPTACSASVRELRIACDAAAVLGVDYVVLHPGPERSGKPPPHEWLSRMNIAADSLNEVALHCHDLGLTLLLENMLPHLMFGHTSDMLFLLGAIRETNVGTCLDTGHAFLSRDLRTVVHKLSGHLRMLHVNDNLGERDDHLPPGEGAIDWISLVRQLHQWKFHGPLVLELAANTGTPAEIMRQARSAADYLKEIIARWGMDRPGPG